MKFTAEDIMEVGQLHTAIRWTAGLLGPLLLSCSTGGQACTAVGCPTAAAFALHFEGMIAELKQCSLRVCQNATCFERSFTGIEEPPAGGATGFTLPSDTWYTTESAHADVTIWPTGSGYDLHFDWTPWSSEDLANGDEYQALITGADGSTRASFSATVDRYTVSQR